jgi:hypothetical protein
VAARSLGTAGRRDYSHATLYQGQSLQRSHQSR